MLITTPDGRSLQVLDGGGDGLPCLFHHGTPGGPVLNPIALQAAADAGLRWIGYGRPGYGDSTPLPGRTVAQAAQDAATVLDYLGVRQFVTYGWSGGGPHALACAALLPDRCVAAATVAGVAPDGAEGLDFLAGMGEENVEEISIARSGRAALSPYLEAQTAGLREVTGAQVAEALGGLISEVDRLALEGAVAEVIATSFREALRVGFDGMIDDDLAFVQPWGFALDQIRAPVAVWQGAQDRMVPFAHGQWLAGHVAGAEPHLLEEHGHISLVFGHLPAILQDLRDLAR